MTVGIILAGGIGKRFNAKIPKQFMSLNGKMVIQYSIDAMKASGVVDYIVVVTSRGWFEFLSKLRYVDRIVGGGVQRTDSVYNGLLACPNNTEYVIFHDAGRPFIKKEHIHQCINELKKKKVSYVGTVELVTDALILVDQNNLIQKSIDRDHIRLYQTPEAFDFKCMMKYYANLTMNYTDIATPLILGGEKGKVILSPDINTKITYARDLTRAEQNIKYVDYITRVPKVKNKDILLLGGSGGIGSEIRNQLEELGANVFCPTRQEFDLSKFGVVRNSQWVYPETFDCIIHCAASYALDQEGLIANYDKIMNVNFRSIVDITEMSLKGLVKPGGNLVFISSTAASKGRSGISIYSASKAALNTFVEAIADTLKEKRDIKVNVIGPAKVATNLQKYINPKSELIKMMKPRDIAKIIISYVDVAFTGNIVYIKDGFLK